MEEVIHQVLAAVGVPAAVAVAVSPVVVAALVAEEVVAGGKA